MTSLSGQFTTISKVVVCAMMIRGRHRGLPYAVDRAVILPGDAENRDQEHEAEESLEGSGLNKGK
jgi:Trk-type K+ transport system membrane component